MLKTPSTRKHPFCNFPSDAYLEMWNVVEHVGLELLKHVLVVHNQLLRGVAVGNVGQQTQRLLLDLGKKAQGESKYLG